MGIEGPAETGEDPLAELRAELARHGGLKSNDLADRLQADQARRWRSGRGVPVEAYLGLQAGARDHPDLVVDLILGEIELRRERGERPDPAEYLRRFPELAEDLGGHLEFDRLLGADDRDPSPSEAPTSGPTTGGGSEATVDQRPSSPAGDSDAGPPSTHPEAGLVRGELVRYLGDYEIQKELGRGGMGVVYKARQISLNRPVALKMIKAGVLADDAELRRFQNEAEAVALLDHAGIVPIYEVSEQDGQRYFSMKLVEGGNLADGLPSFRANPRAAATLLAETAEAVHHAHMRGILHRDLKPANILVDADGHPHVTDFGLAKRVEGDVEMTASGAIMGTPAYMSPEQANGRRGTITTATDVYGLGAILYALLTGKAPFGGESVIQTLDAVRNTPPEPPKRLNAGTPRDLETICLKCLEKDPRRRHASAQALADDLHAWLGSRPISARRVGSSERAWLWCKRKPVVAALAASVVLAVVLGTAGVIAVQARANSLLRSSNSLLDQQRRRAEEREQQAIDAVKRFRDVVADNPDLKDNPSLESLRKTLLKEPVAFFRSLRASLQADRDTRPESLVRLAGAILEYAVTTDEIGDLRDELQSLEEGRTIWEKLAADHPMDPKYQSGLAIIHNRLGTAMGATGRTDEARRSLEAALAIEQKLANDQPSVIQHRHELASSHHKLGLLLSGTGELDAARRAHEAALSIRRQLVDANPSVARFRSDLAASQGNLGHILRRTGQNDPALAAFKAARDTFDELVTAHPSVVLYRRELGAGQSNLASLLRVTGQLDAARETQEAALAIRQELADAHPAITRYQIDLAQSHYNLGNVLRDLGRNDAALKAYDAAQSIRQKLADLHPSVTEYQGELALGHGSRGHILFKAGQLDRAREAFEAGLRIWERLARDHPESPDPASMLGSTLHDLAALDFAARRFDEARQGFQRAIVWQKKAMAANPRNPQYRSYLANDLSDLAKTARTLGQDDLTTAALRELSELQASDPRLAALDARLAAVLKGEAARSNAERLELAQRAYQVRRYASAARLWADALQADPKVAESRQDQHRYNAACAAALAGSGAAWGDGPPPDDAARARLRHQALDWMNAELADWTKLLETAPQARSAIVQALQHWKEDTDLAGLRDAKALESLPVAEREPCRALWASVDATLARAQTAPFPGGNK